MVSRKLISVSVLFGVFACAATLAEVPATSLDALPRVSVAPVAAIPSSSPAKVMPDRIIRFSSAGVRDHEIVTPVVDQAARKRVPMITQATFLGVLTALGAMIGLAIFSYARAAVRVRASSRSREAQIMQEVAIAAARLKHAAPASAVSSSKSPVVAAASTTDASKGNTHGRVHSLRADQDENSYQNWNARRVGLTGFDPQGSRAARQ